MKACVEKCRNSPLTLHLPLCEAADVEQHVSSLLSSDLVMPTNTRGQENENFKASGVPLRGLREALASRRGHTGCLTTNGKLLLCSCLCSVIYRFCWWEKWWGYWNAHYEAETIRSAWFRPNVKEKTPPATYTCRRQLGPRQNFESLYNVFVFRILGVFPDFLMFVSQKWP